METPSVGNKGVECLHRIPPRGAIRASAGTRQRSGSGRSGWCARPSRSRTGHGVVTRVAGQLGLGSETLRKWVKQAEVDDGERPGVTSEEHQRITELERENRELRRANEILKVAAAFLARELDPRLPT